MSRRRVYPARPMVGVGVLIRECDRYLIVERAADPDAGLWSIPGGLVEIGEKATDAAVREAKEETGLDVEIGELLEVVDRIIRDDSSKVKYHFTIIDFLATPKGGTMKAASDARQARWVRADEFTRYELTPTLIELLKRKRLFPT